jgi:hypothetical protein
VAVLLPFDLQPAAERPPSATRVDGESGCDWTEGRLHSRDRSAPHPQAQRLDGLQDEGAKLAGPVEQDGVEIGPPRLEPQPGPVLVGTEVLDELRARPVDEDPRIAQEARGEDAILDSELSEQGLDTGMERLTRGVSREGLSLQDGDPQARTGAPDRRRRSGRTRAQDDHVEVRQRSRPPSATWPRMES